MASRMRAAPDIVAQPWPALPLDAWQDTFYSDALKEFVLPYDAVRRAVDPERTLLEFLRSTYEAAADLGHWNRKALERGPFP